MAQDLSVDLEVKILIVAKHPKNMKLTCEHLARFGWSTTCMNSIPKALEFIKNERPDIVLLSFNHPSESIHKLPELFERSREVLCIGFVEGSDVISANLLTGVKIKHKIFGQPSGPNFQRGISQALTQWVPVNKRKIEQPVAPLAEAKVRAQAAIGEAFGKMCLPMPGGGSPSVLAEVKRVGVFRFDSPELPGYLVLAQNPLTATSEFLKGCEPALAEAFGKNKLEGKFGAGFFIDFPEVEFKTWAANSSAMNLTFDHLGVELGVAFFQAHGPLPKLRAVAGVPMMGLNLDLLPKGEPMPVKLYLHLRANNKFYMYLRDGRELQPEQLGRLQNRHVREMFIKAPDVEKMNRFWAEVYLRESLKIDPKAA